MSVKSHLTTGASVRCENAATYSAGDEGKKISGDFFLKLFRCRDRALPLMMAIHRVSHFSHRKHACALFIRKFDEDRSRCVAPYAIAVSSPCVLALR